MIELSLLKARNPFVAMRAGVAAAIILLAIVATLAGTGKLSDTRLKTARPVTASIGTGEDAAHEALLLAGKPPRVEPLIISDIDRTDARRINALVPLVKDGVTPARPLRFAGAELDRQRATACLAAAQWYEAGDDPADQQAVAQVVINRARHPAFPKSICGVVFQGEERVTGCQFTFTCDGALRRTPSAAQWAASLATARKMLDGTVNPAVGLATHYHTDWVVPYWSSSLDKIAAIRTHLFFRWKGGWGRSFAFRSPLSAREPAIAKLAALSPVHGTDGMALGYDLAETTAAETAATAPAARFTPMMLRGSKVQGFDERSATYFLGLNTGAPSGSYAIIALELCKGRPACHVMGWLDPQAIPTQMPLSGAAKSAVAFMYARESVGGEELILWDCTRLPRSRPTDCIAGRIASWNTRATDKPAPVPR